MCTHFYVTDEFHHWEFYPRIPQAIENIEDTSNILSTHICYQVPLYRKQDISRKNQQSPVTTKEMIEKIQYDSSRKSSEECLARKSHPNFQSSYEYSSCFPMRSVPDQKKIKYQPSYKYIEILPTRSQSIKEEIEYCPTIMILGESNVPELCPMETTFPSSDSERFIAPTKLQAQQNNVRRKQTAFVQVSFIISHERVV